MVDGIGDHLEESAADGVCDDWFCFSGNPGQQQWCCNFSRNAVCIVWHVCERWQKNGMLLAGNDIVIGGMSDHIYSAELQCAFAGTPMEKVTDILTFSAMSVILTIVSVVVLWLVHTSNNRNQYCGKLFWGIYRILCVALPVVSVALLAFILANTLLGGKLTSFLTETAGDGGSNWLVFSAAWGSNRGATWSTGARCFWEADLLHKIFGVGPDCMYAFLSNEASRSCKYGV